MIKELDRDATKLNVAVDKYRMTRAEKELIQNLTVPVPDNESYRIRVLRQTDLLDSNPNDPDFDRYTSLAKRIFNVPMSLISLVDVNRQWFKSRVGVEPLETGRNESFCAHIVATEDFEVLVVMNALHDSRFNTNPLVVGNPNIRFYAGVALSVAGVRLGTLCIIDIIPRETFTLEDRMNLMDVGQAVATLIHERRESHLRSCDEKAAMMLSLAHDIRTPLMSAGIASSLLTYYSEQLLKNCICEHEDSSLASNIRTSLEELTASLGKVEEVVDACKVATDQLLAAVGGEFDGDYPSPSYCVDTGRSMLSPPNDVSRKDYCSKAGLRGEFGTGNLCAPNTIRSRRGSINLAHKYAGGVTVFRLEDFAENFVTQNSHSHIPKPISRSDHRLTHRIFHLVEGSKYKLCENTLRSVLLVAVQKFGEFYSDLELSFSFALAGSSQKSECVISEVTQPEVEGNMCVRLTALHLVSRVVSTTQTITVSRPVSPTRKKLIHPTIVSEVDKSQHGGIIRAPGTATNIPSSLVTSNVTPKADFVQEFPSSTDCSLSDTNTSGIQEGMVSHHASLASSPIGHVHESWNELPSLYELVKSTMESIDSLVTDCQGDVKIQLLDITSCALEMILKVPCVMINNSELSPSSKSLANTTTFIANNTPEPCGQVSLASNPERVTKMEDSTNSKSAVATASKANFLSVVEDDYHFGQSPMTTELRVIVIDDSVPLQKGLKRLFESQGCYVDIAANGKIGLDLLKSNQYDVALLDFLMPVMSGPEMLKHYQEWRGTAEGAVADQNSNMLIWGMSATANTPEQSQVLEKGMHMFSPKPLGHAILTVMLSTKGISLTLRDWVENIVENSGEVKHNLRTCYDTVTPNHAINHISPHASFLTSSLPAILRDRLNSNKSGRSPNGVLCVGASGESNGRASLFGSVYSSNEASRSTSVKGPSSTQVKDMKETNSRRSRPRLSYVTETLKSISSGFSSKGIHNGDDNSSLSGKGKKSVSGGSSKSTKDVSNIKGARAGSAGSSNKSVGGSENSCLASSSGSSKSFKMNSSDAVIKTDDFDYENCKITTQVHKSVSFSDDQHFRSDHTLLKTTNITLKSDHNSFISDADFTRWIGNSCETPAIVPETTTLANSHSLENLGNHNSNRMHNCASRATVEEARHNSKGSCKENPLPQRKSLLDNHLRGREPAAARSRDCLPIRSHLVRDGSSRSGDVNLLRSRSPWISTSARRRARALERQMELTDDSGEEGKGSKVSRRTSRKN